MNPAPPSRPGGAVPQKSNNSAMIPDIAAKKTSLESPGALNNMAFAASNRQAFVSESLCRRGSQVVFQEFSKRCEVVANKDHAISVRRFKTMKQAIMGISFLVFTSCAARACRRSGDEGVGF